MIEDDEQMEDPYLTIYMWLDKKLDDQALIEKRNQEVESLKEKTGKDVYVYDDFIQYAKKLLVLNQSKVIFTLCHPERLHDLILPLLLKAHHVFERTIVYKHDPEFDYYDWEDYIYAYPQNQAELLPFLEQAQIDYDKSITPERAAAQLKNRKIRKKYINAPLRVTVYEPPHKAVWIDKNIKQNLLDKIEKDSNKRYFHRLVMTAMHVTIFDNVEQAMQYVLTTPECDVLTFANNVADEILENYPIEQIKHYIIFCEDKPEVGKKMIEEKGLDPNKFFITNVENTFVGQLMVIETGT